MRSCLLQLYRYRRHNRVPKRVTSSHLSLERIFQQSFLVSIHDVIDLDHGAQQALRLVHPLQLGNQPGDATNTCLPRVVLIR